MTGRACLNPWHDLQRAGVRLLLIPHQYGRARHERCKCTDLAVLERHGDAPHHAVGVVTPRPALEIAQLLLQVARMLPGDQGSTRDHWRRRAVAGYTRDDTGLLALIEY